MVYCLSFVSSNFYFTPNQDIKKGCKPQWSLQPFDFLYKNEELNLGFLLAITIAVEELINTTCGVNEFLLTGEEGVRSIGNFKLNQWVGLTVDFNSLF